MNHARLTSNFPQGPQRPVLIGDDEFKPFRVVSIGGTFNAFHEGHRAYLRMALSLADNVHLLIAGDSYAKQRKGYEPRRFTRRKQAIEDFLQELDCSNRVETEELTDPMQVQDYLENCKNLDLVLTERAYFDDFDELNEARQKNGLAAYSILCKARTRLHGIEITSTMLVRKRPRVRFSGQTELFSYSRK